MMFTFAALQLFVNTRQYIRNASEYADSFSALSLKKLFISSKISTLSFHFDASWIDCTFFEKSGIADSNYMSHASSIATAVIALSLVYASEPSRHGTLGVWRCCTGMATTDAGILISHKYSVEPRSCFSLEPPPLRNWNCFPSDA